MCLSVQRHFCHIFIGRHFSLLLKPSSIKMVLIPEDVNIARETNLLLLNVSGNNSKSIKTKSINFFSYHFFPSFEQVRCAVCKSIFCCHECRKRHELNAHNPNDVWAERNRLQCGLCQGYSTMEFQSRNDFALIMHLCQTHLPLHCKKCLTVNIGLPFCVPIVLSLILCVSASSSVCDMQHRRSDAQSHI